ncbi:MAG: DUF2130 domain-containing protein, partial [Proteobacteria bacterium]
MNKRINCPACGHGFPIEAAIAHSIRAEVGEEYLAKEKAFQRILREEQAKAAKALDQAQQESAERWDRERLKIENHAKEIASLELSRKQREQEQQIKAQSVLIEEFRNNETNLLAQKAQLEHKASTVDLEIARGLDKGREELFNVARAELSSQFELRIKEAELANQTLIAKVKEMSRSAEQKSQQLQGESLEQLLQGQLKEEFPDDEIEEIKKGMRGGDFNQLVRMRSGAECGAIHVECKNTKDWSDAWVAKAKEDTRKHKAHLTVIVSVVVPKEISSFGLYDGVFVCSPAYSRQLITLLRINLINAHKSRLAIVGKADTKEFLYDYFMGVQFRQRIEKMIEVQCSMRDGLEREKRAYLKLFSQREKQVDAILEN